jgi:hypothetical protein
MVLPPSANVYYAVNTAFNLNFILRPKRSNALDTAALSRTKPPKKSPSATWSLKLLGGRSQVNPYWYYCSESWWHRRYECSCRVGHELTAIHEVLCIHCAIFSGLVSLLKELVTCWWVCCLHVFCICWWLSYFFSWRKIPRFNVQILAYVILLLWLSWLFSSLEHTV